MRCLLLQPRVCRAAGRIGEAAARVTPGAIQPGDEIVMACHKSDIGRTESRLALQQGFVH
jgi:hypothetical protein